MRVIVLAYLLCGHVVFGCPAKLTTMITVDPVTTEASKETTAPTTVTTWGPSDPTTTPSTAETSTTTESITVTTPGPSTASTTESSTVTTTVPKTTVVAGPACSKCDPSIVKLESDPLENEESGDRHIPTAELGNLTDKGCATLVLTCAPHGDDNVLYLGFYNATSNEDIGGIEGNNTIAAVGILICNEKNEWTYTNKIDNPDGSSKDPVTSVIVRATCFDGFITE